MNTTPSGRERGRMLRDRIFAEIEKESEDYRPNRLRPSEMGAECGRYLWLRYRWADKFEKFSGRMKRLFETGHLQEDRLAEDIRRTGARMYVKDPENPKQQISTMAMDGHIKGFLDGVGENVPYAVCEFVLTEMKSHNKKSFAMLDKDGVAACKPQHYAQMQFYLHQHGLGEALYIAVNKDNDDLYCEFVDYDKRYAEGLLRKAQMVVFSKTPPERISQNPTFFKCKYCSAQDVCHLQDLPPRSCRTCKWGEPAVKEGAELPTWYCNFHEAELDLDQQKRGCNEHRFNSHMVRGEVVSETDHIVYQDGDLEFVDSGPESEQSPADPPRLAELTKPAAEAAQD